MRTYFRKGKGFTLVEVIVVLVILAILAAILIPSLTGWIDKAKEKQVTVELREVALAAETSYQEVYAKYSLGAATQVIYLSGQTSAESWDREFATLMKQYLSGDVSWANVKSVTMTGNYLYISYTKSSVRYLYSRSVDGTVAITKR